MKISSCPIRWFHQPSIFVQFEPLRLSKLMDIQTLLTWLVFAIGYLLMSQRKELCLHKGVSWGLKEVTCGCTEVTWGLRKVALVLIEVTWGLREVVTWGLREMTLGLREVT